MDAFFADLVGPAANLQRQTARVHSTSVVLAERHDANVTTDRDRAQTCKRIAEAVGVPEWIVAPSLAESLAARRISIDDAADAASRVFDDLMTGLIDSKNAFDAIVAQLERRREATDEDRQVMGDCRRAFFELALDPVNRTAFQDSEKANLNLYDVICRPPTADRCLVSRLGPLEWRCRW